MSTKVPDEFVDLFSDEKKAFGFVGTVMTDGTPQVTPVWIDYDGEYISFNTAKGRVKERNLRRNPSVAITLVDPENPYRHIQIRGKASFVEQGADDHINRLAKKYIGLDEYPNRQPGEERIIVRIKPESVSTMG